MNDLLIHIGYHKTATTWLQQVVFRRQKMGFQRIHTNVPDFLQHGYFSFDAEKCRNSIEHQVVDATSRGVIPVLSHERFSGNPQSGGYDSKEIANCLATAFPQAKILIVIREQCSRIVSCYKQYVKVGGPCTFHGYISPPTKGQMRIPLFRLEHFEYHALIQYYQQLFGPERVLVLPYELLVREPISFVSQIVTHAGARPSFDLRKLPFGKSRNTSPSPIAAEIACRTNRVARWDTINPQPWIRSEGFATFLYRGSVRVGNSMPRRLQRRIEQDWITKIRQLAGNRFAMSNTRTSQATQLDLKRFEYDFEEHSVSSRPKLDRPAA